jgi:23S rRNA A1618 N6-methylase RlmF
LHSPEQKGKMFKEIRVKLHSKIQKLLQGLQNGNEKHPFLPPSPPSYTNS